MNYLVVTLLCCGLLAMACLSKAASDNGAVQAPYQRSAVPANGVITLTDYGIRDWGPELVHYTVDTGKFPPGKLALISSDGNTVPFQIEDGVLAFVAFLPKSSSVSYTLKPSADDQSMEHTTLRVTQNAAGVEIANEFLALHVPPPGEKSYPDAVDAATVPAPITQWRQLGQEWLGGARFATTRKITAQSFKFVRRGPACVEYEAHYTFAPKGEYVMRLQLYPGVPYAHVTEEFDMGETTAGEDFLLLELNKGWQPQHIGWVVGTGEQNPAGFQAADYAAYVARMKNSKPPVAPVGGVGQEPAIAAPEPDMFKLAYLGAGAQIQGSSGGVQLWDGDAPGMAQNIGMVSLHSGSWRRTMAIPVWQQEGAGLVAGLPISVRPLRWSLEVADDFSPFSTHEHDESLPRTYGRREWGLYFGPGLATAQPRFGHIGLDRYKDWIVDWPEGAAAKDAYPGGFFTKAHVESLRDTLEQNPSADALRNRYLISGKVEDAVQNAQNVINRLKSPRDEYREHDFFLWGMANYRKSQLLIYVNEAEDALACPQLPADLRQELRRWLALYAYVTSDPDFNPRGSGVHLGNNNMPINRTMSLAYFAGLLPDHPCYAYWMNCLKVYTAFKLGTYYSPTGESLECPTYSTYAPAGALNIAQNVLRNRGIADFTKAGTTRKYLEYMANLTMPDIRYQSRIIPGMGNSSNDQDGIWGVSVGTFADQDAKFAGWCKAMFKSIGGKFGQISTGVTFEGHPMYYLPAVPDTPLHFATTFMPAYGVAFRAHFGSLDETAMLLRAGTNWGHWDTDALNVVLYGKGAPLSPGTGYQYYGGVANKDNALTHNQVKVGQHDLQEVFGRVDDAIEDYGFGASADYAVADRYYPPEIFADKQGEMHWRRHVLFLKSDDPQGANYFVMRDTFPGGEQRNKWWTWLNLDMPDNIKVDGTAFAKDAVPVEQVIPEADMPTLHGQTIEMATAFGASTWCWFSEPHDIRVRGIMRYGAARIGNETKTIIEALAGPRQDYFYVVFPKKNAETPPACAKPADGVLKITTNEAVDYAFLADTPFTFNQDGILFTGKAGAVRVFKDRVELCLNSGVGRVGYRGMIFAGYGPFEKVVPLKNVKRGVTNIAGDYEKKIITMDIGQGITVRGEAPFAATLDGQTIRITTQGRARVLQVTKPPFIIRPQLWVDGQEGMASWTDYPANGWGSYKNSMLIALPVADGTHELVVKDLVYPPVWQRPFTPLLDK